MQDNAQTIGFTAGELSPWLATRYDLQAYQRGARKLENFLVQPYGGLRRRRGSQYISSAAAQSVGAVRLMPFKFSESDILMLEFFPSGIYVYRDGVKLQKNGQPYKIQTPWTTPELVASLRFMQVNDVVYVTSPDFPTVKLLRHDNTDWSYTPLSMEPYPRETYLSQSVGLKVFVEPAANYASLELESGSWFSESMNNNEYIIADAPVETKTLFLNESMSIKSTALPNLSNSAIAVNTICHEYNSASGMNEYFTCIRSYTSDQYNGSLHAKDYPHFFQPGVMRLVDGKNPYEVCGDWELRTNGEWDGLWELWRSYNSLKETSFIHSWEWTCIKTFGQDSFSTRQNWALTGSEDIPCRMVLVCRAYKGTNIGPIMYFRSMGGTREYTYLITRVNSSKEARARIMSPYSEQASSYYTKKWSFGAFGFRNGFPRFSGLHQGRLWLGGARGLPTTLIGSTVGDFENFRVRSADDSALHLTLSTDDQSRICWICPMRNLLVGTTESEWTLAAPDGGSVTASNAAFSRQSAVGSEDKVAYGVENTVFYVQRGGKRLREISYKLEADGYTSTDSSLLAEHLFASGIKEWAVQRGTCIRLWTLMNDGTLAVLTTNPEQQVAAWQRATFPRKKVLSVTSIASLNRSEDEVWFVMQNTNNNHISLERIKEDSEYIDGYCELKPSSGQSVNAGLHLAGMAGFAYPKGKPEEAQNITFTSTGTCNIAGFKNGQTYCIGSAYESTLETLPLEKETSFNTVQQHGRVKLRLLESAVQFSYKSSHATRWETYEAARDMLTPPFTGAIRISQIPSPGVGQGFTILAKGAMDFALVALTVEVDFHGR